MSAEAPAGSEMADFDLRFATQFGDGALLDADGIERALAPRLERIARVESPFPHIWAEDFLPEAFFRVLDAAWPPLSAYQADRTRQKLNMVPRLDPEYNMTGGYADLPQQVRDVWSFFIEQVNRRVVTPWLKRVFAAEIAERVAALQSLDAEGRVGFSVSGLRTGRVEANHGRMMVRGAGYALDPHIDPAPYVVTVLHYFADRQDEGFGTRLYEAASSIPFDQFAARGSTHYFARHGIEVQEARCLPFVRNGFLAFPNLLNAAHGVVAPEQGYRRVFQYHLSLKGDHESV